MPNDPNTDDNREEHRATGRRRFLSARGQTLLGLLGAAWLLAIVAAGRLGTSPRSGALPMALPPRASLEPSGGVSGSAAALPPRVPSVGDARPVSEHALKEFCAHIRERANDVVQAARKHPEAPVELITEFRMQADKCSDEVMGSPAVCQLFTEFPAAAAQAFAPIYGGSADGRGIWIKQECVVPLLAFGDAARAARLRSAYDDTLRRLSRVVPYEYSGFGADRTELSVRSLLTDWLNGIAATDGAADLERALKLVEPRVRSVRARVAAAKRDLVPSLALLVEARCGLVKSRGQPLPGADCATQMNGVVDEVAALYLEAAAEESYRGTPAALLR